MDRIETVVSELEHLFDAGVGGIKVVEDGDEHAPEGDDVDDPLVVLSEYKLVEVGTVAKEVVVELLLS